jgi:hypothetical protein
MRSVDPVSVSRFSITGRKSTSACEPWRNAMLMMRPSRAATAILREM